MKTLRRLNVSFSLVRDLAPIRNLKLEHLDVRWTAVVSLRPIYGMPLKSLRTGGPTQPAKEDVDDFWKSVPGHEKARP
jgi:hypothetical protein